MDTILTTVENDKINTVIQHLFDTRKQKKKEKNPIEKTIKLLMNSIYGKTILKPIDTELKVIPHWKFNSFAVRHYNFIKEVVRVGSDYYVKLIRSIHNHFIFVHVGVEVLSTSKRIVNEVMCTAEDNNLNIYYQDTDSMRIVYDQVPILADCFKKEIQ